MESNDVDDVVGRTIRLHLQRYEATKTGEAGDAAHSGEAGVTFGSMMDSDVDTLHQPLDMSMSQTRDEAVKTGDSGGAAPAGEAAVKHGTMMGFAMSMTQAQAQSQSIPPVVQMYP